MQALAPDSERSPPAQMAIDAAAATLEFGGTSGLRALLAGMERQRVFALDESGREMNGADGHRYLLFLPATERQHGPDAGAAGPPLTMAMTGPEPRAQACVSMMLPRLVPEVRARLGAAGCDAPA